MKALYYLKFILTLVYGVVYNISRIQYFKTKPITTVIFLLVSQLP